MSTTIAARVRQKLVDSPLTQSALGERIGLAKTKMSRALNGTRAFSTGELAAIAEILDADLYWLIGGAPSPHSPRFAYRHTFDETAGGHVRPSDALGAQVDAVLLAYQQAQLPRNSLLADFRARTGADAFTPDAPPATFADTRRVMRETQRRWREWLAEGNDPVIDLRSFLDAVFGVDLVIADVPGTQRVTTHAVQVAGASVIIAERSGSWYSTLFGIFHELAHLLFNTLAWRGEKDTLDEAAFEPLANGFAGDVLLGRDELTQDPQIADLTLEQLAEHLWRHGIGLATARLRCETTRVEAPPEAFTQGSITMQWMRDHSDSPRLSAWSSPSYPPRLIERHEELVPAGDLPAETLAWMLGVPPEDVAVQPDPRRHEEGTQALLEQLGLSR